MYSRSSSQPRPGPRRQLDHARRRAPAGSRRGSTRSGRDRDGSTRRRCRAGSTRAGGMRPAAPRGGPSRTSNVSAIAATRRHSVGPPDQEASKLQTSIAPLDHQVAAAGGRELALARAHRRPARRARTSRIARAVVVPAARLLEPDESVVLDEPREARAPPRASTLIRVRSEHEVVARRRRARTDARRRPPRARAARP